MERFVVIGLGAFGGPLARRLAQKGQDVLGIDKDPRPVNDIKDEISRAVIADATDRDTLEALGISEFTTGVVAIGEHREANIMISALLRELGIPRILARATSPLHARILRSIGVHKVLSPEAEYGTQIADSLVSSFTLERFPLTEGILVAEVAVDPVMDGQSLSQLDLRNRFGIIVVAIQSSRTALDEDGKSREIVDVISPPDPELALKEGESLVVLGDEKALDAMGEAYGG